MLIIVVIHNFDLHIFFILCFNSRKSYANLSFQNIHIFTTKSLRMLTKCLISGKGMMVGSVCTVYWTVKHLSCTSAL